MGDLSWFSPLNSLLGKTVTRAQRFLARQYVDHYDENRVQENVLNRLDQIHLDTQALREGYLHTAVQAWRDWEMVKQDTLSCDLLLTDCHLKKLDDAMDNSRKAFNTVADPLRKMEAATILILASYERTFWTQTAHRLRTETAHWQGCSRVAADVSEEESEVQAAMQAKKEAVRLLRRQTEEIDFPKLTSAAKEELGLPASGRNVVRRLLPANVSTRTKLLAAFCDLYSMVFFLSPCGIDMPHVAHMDLLKKAVFHCFRKDPRVSLAPLLREPKHRNTLRVGENNFSLAVTCCVVLSDRKRAIIGRKDASLRLIDLRRNGNRITSFKGHAEAINCCVAYREDTRLLSASDDKTLKVWDIENGKALQTLYGHAAPVSCCVVYHNEERILSGCLDGCLIVWALLEGAFRVRAVLGARRSVPCPIFSVAVYGNNTKAFSGGNHCVRVWDLDREEEFLSAFPVRGKVRNILVCEKQEMAISAGCHGDVLKWNLSDDASPSSPLHCANDPAWDIEEGSAADSWSTPRPEPCPRMSRRQEHISCCAVSPDDESWIISVSAQGSLVLRDVESGSPLYARYMSRRVGITSCAAISNTMVLMGHENGDVKLLELPVLSPSLLSPCMREKMLAGGRRRRLRDGEEVAVMA